MDQALIERIRADMAYEFARTAPPPDFPAFHDIPAGRHISAEFEALEHTNLWPRTWAMAGRAEDVPHPGDYVVFDRLGPEVLLVRASDGAVNAFYNTCQHRGAPVVRKPKGSARRLRCQYHSWTYDADDGALIAVPDERDFVNLDWQQRCLPKIRCEIFGGFVFINLDPEAMPLQQFIGPAAEMLEPFGCETWREVYRESTIIPCNWKVTAEAFLEVYHFKHIHNHKGIALLDDRGAAMGLYPNVIIPFGREGFPINYQERRIWHLHEEIDRTIGVDAIPSELRVAQLLDGYVEHSR